MGPQTLFLCFVVAFLESQALDLVMLDENYVKEYGAYCLDGTPTGYYYRKSIAQPTDDAYNSWVFFLEGGGVCAEPIDCEVRKFTRLGSSNNWTKSFTDHVRTISTDPKVNPFWNWNHVFFPYCTGDTHTGTMFAPDILGFHFSGHNGIKARFEHLKATANLSNVTHILLSGQSAGGIGVFNNADYFKKSFPTAYIKAAPEAGYFFPSNVAPFETWALGLHIPYTDLASKYLVSWYHSKLDESCVAANPNTPYLCWDASFVYPYIEVDFMIASNMYDEVVLQFLGWMQFAPLSQKYLAYFGDTTVASVLNHTKPGSGYFIPACYDHTGNLCVGSSTLVNGHKFVDVLYDWYWGKNKLPHQLIDSCWKKGSLPCNPDCPNLCG